MQREDEDRVEHRGHDAARERHIHGAPGVAGRAQQPREAHAEAEQRRARQQDGEIAPGERVRASAGADDAEQRVQQRQAAEAEQRAGEARIEQARGREAPRILAPAGPEGAGDERRRGDRDAERDRGHEEEERRGEADRGGKLLLAEPRDVEEIGEIDDEDGHQAHRAGRRHDHDMAQDRAFDEARAKPRPGSCGGAHGRPYWCPAAGRGR